MGAALGLPPAGVGLAGLAVVLAEEEPAEGLAAVDMWEGTPAGWLGLDRIGFGWKDDGGATASMRMERRARWKAGKYGSVGAVERKPHGAPGRGRRGRRRTRGCIAGTAGVFGRRGAGINPAPAGVRHEFAPPRVSSDLRAAKGIDPSREVWALGAQ